MAKGLYFLLHSTANWPGEDLRMFTPQLHCMTSPCFSHYDRLSLMKYFGRFEEALIQIYSGTLMYEPRNQFILLFTLFSELFAAVMTSRKSNSDESLFRIAPFHYIHVLDQNTNVTRLEIGPQTFIRQDNERCATFLTTFHLPPIPILSVFIICVFHG